MFLLNLIFWTLIIYSFWIWKFTIESTHHGLLKNCLFHWESACMYFWHLLVLMIVHISSSLQCFFEQLFRYFVASHYVSLQHKFVIEFHRTKFTKKCFLFVATLEFLMTLKRVQSNVTPTTCGANVFVECANSRQKFFLPFRLVVTLPMIICN